MEEAKYGLSEQLSLDFELVVDIAKRVCERYGIHNCGAGESAYPAEQSLRAS